MKKDKLTIEDTPSSLVDEEQGLELASSEDAIEDAGTEAEASCEDVVATHDTTAAISTSLQAEANPDDPKGEAHAREREEESNTDDTPSSLVGAVGYDEELGLVVATHPKEEAEAQQGEEEEESFQDCQEEPFEDCQEEFCKASDAARMQDASVSSPRHSMSKEEDMSDRGVDYVIGIQATTPRPGAVAVAPMSYVLDLELEEESLPDLPPMQNVYNYATSIDPPTEQAPEARLVDPNEPVFPSTPVIESIVVPLVLPCPTSETSETTPSNTPLPLEVAPQAPEPNAPDYCLTMRMGFYIFAAIILMSLVTYLALIFPLESPTPRPTLSPTRQPLQPFYHFLPFSVLDDIANFGSPKALANEWMWNDPNLDSYSLDRQMQRFMMVSAYYSTGGPTSWENNTNWLSYDISECEWHQNHPTPVCDENDNLQIINMTSNGLEGIIPDEMFTYLKLKVSDMANNSLYGSRPLMDRAGAGIEVLSWANNNFEGQMLIHIGVGEISLRHLELQNNNFSSLLPMDGEGGLLVPNLTYVDFSNNQFYGTIPNVFQMVPKLEVIKFANNTLSGTIGDTIRALTKLRHIDVSGNKDIRGVLPEQLGHLPALEYADFRNTRITIPIPKSLCNRAATGALKLWLSGCGRDGGDGWMECCTLSSRGSSDVFS